MKLEIQHFIIFLPLLSLNSSAGVDIQYSLMICLISFYFHLSMVHLGKKSFRLRNIIYLMLNCYYHFFAAPRDKASLMIIKYFNLIILTELLTMIISFLLLMVNKFTNLIIIKRNNIPLLAIYY